MLAAAAAAAAVELRVQGLLAELAGQMVVAGATASDAARSALHNSS